VTWLAVLSSLGIGVLLIAGFFCLLLVNRKFPSGSLRPLLNAWQQLSVILQFDSDWPDALKSLAAVLQSINLDVPMAGPVCLGIPFNFYFRLVFAVVTTAVLIVGPWLHYLIRLTRRKSTTEQLLLLYYQTLSDTVITVLILHPPISGLAIQIFRCETFESPLQNISMLVSDYSIECHDGAWNWMAFFAVAILALFSFGIPALFARLMYRRRHKLHFTPEEQRYLDSVRRQKKAGASTGDGEETSQLSTSAIAPVIVDVDANTFGANNADHQQKEGLSAKMLALLETIRIDGMTAETERALVAEMGKPEHHLDDTGDGGGGESKASDGTTAGRPSPKRIRDVERTRKLLGILFETYRAEMYYFEAIQMVFKVLLWTSLVMFEKGKVNEICVDRRTYSLLRMLTLIHTCARTHTHTHTHTHTPQNTQCL
jgi:hypothetical protein